MYNSQASEIDTILRASFRRNAAAAVSWEIVWGFGAACCLMYMMIPAYLLALGASKTLVQIVMLIFPITTGLQLLSSNIIHGPRRKLYVFLVWSLFPGSWLIYMLAASIGWGRLPSGIWLPFFILTCAALAIIMHLGAPAYNELVVENMPLKKRGQLGAMRLIGLGIFGMIGAKLASYLMNQKPEPFNFHSTIMIGSSIMLASCISILFIRDNAQKLQNKKTQALQPLKAVTTLFNNFNFRVFLVFYGLLIAGQALAPLFIGYSKDVLGMSLNQVTYFSAAYFVGPILVGILVLPLADRYGFRLIIILSAAMLALAFFLPLVSQGNRYALLIGYAFFAGSLGLNILILANFGAELVPDMKPAVIIATGNTLVMPLSLVVAPMGGRLADIYGAGGYLAVLVMGVTLSVCALVGFILLVREPRTGQEIYVRIRRA